LLGRARRRFDLGSSAHVTIQWNVAIRFYITVENPNLCQAILRRGTMEVTFGPCCFCAMEITETETDPCQITVETRKNQWQTWHCHGSCFKAKLSSPPEAPDLFEPAHF
jgi:hypothetical protein